MAIDSIAIFLHFKLGESLRMLIMFIVEQQHSELLL